VTAPKRPTAAQVLAYATGGVALADLPWPALRNLAEVVLLAAWHEAVDEDLRRVTAPRGKAQLRLVVLDGSRVDGPAKGRAAS